jgi:glyoxylase-like metal-dependent hydrolase (beta-lactamase superfamily II)
VTGEARIGKTITSGVFSLDGQDFDVDNNVWLIGDDSQVLVIDAAHDAETIRTAIGDRELLGVISTHGHNDHINAAVAVAGGAPIYLHPADRMLWDVVHPDVTPELLADGQTFTIAGLTLTVMHTPGHSPGAVCLYLPDLGTLLSGDTLFCGGPGATGRSFSSFPTILESIRTRLLDLPPDTVVYTGHGDPTTIGAEAENYDAWVARGH